MWDGGRSTLKMVEYRLPVYNSTSAIRFEAKLIVPLRPLLTRSDKRADLLFESAPSARAGRGQNVKEDVMFDRG